LYLGEKILLNGHEFVFNLRSERNIIDVFKVKITATFLSCLGQFVDTFRELQFKALKERLERGERLATPVASA
jgi:hypothetical protein